MRIARMSRRLRATIIEAAVAGAMLALVACGGAPQGSKPPPASTKKSVAEEGAVRKIQKEEKGDLSFEDNPRWVPIRPHFATYSRVPTPLIKDAFQPNLVNFVPPPKEIEFGPPKPEGPAAPAAKVDPEKILDPLQRYPLRDYRLVMIAGGTANPKGVVVDPKGAMHEVMRGTLIGDHEGRVTDVLQYKVIIEEPDPEKDTLKVHELSIQPEAIEFQSSSSDDDDPDEPTPKSKKSKKKKY